MADQCHGKVHDAAGQTACIHDFTRQHEEWNRQQREAVGALKQVLREDLRIEHVEVPHQGSTAQQQGKSDGHTQRHRADQRAQKNQNGHGSKFRA